MHFSRSLTLFFALFFIRAAFAQPQTVPVTLANYAALPVHATTATLDETALRAKLGLPEGAPLRLKNAAGEMVPMIRAVERGKPVLRVLASLAPMSRLDLVAEKAERWETFLPAATCDDKGGVLRNGVLRNGVLRVTFGPKGWNLGFDTARPETALLVENAALQFWVDGQNRGRLMNQKPEDFNLASFAAATLEKCSAEVAPGGTARLIRTRRMGGLAKAMTVTETFELVPGTALFICRIRWQNEGDAPLWIAYVGSGDGIAGRWSRALLPAPLIQRKKSAVLGDLNGSETRPAWIGQLCRTTMESPATGCGFGMSTLLPTPGKVGQGSMIWGVGASGFQTNLIDPEQGQFPFLVKPRGALENGFVYMATQSGESVFRRTVELWQELQKNALSPVAPACAVFLDGEPVAAQTIAGSGAMRGLLLNDTAAVRLDFNKSYECRFAAEGAVELFARPFNSNKPAVSLGQFAAGAHRLSLNQKLGAKDEAAWVFSIKNGAALREFSIVETLSAAPQPLAPLPDASFTDIATMFRWKAVPLVVDYDLEWARTADFANANRRRIAQSDPIPWFTVPEAEVPTPGVWFWRVRGVKGDLLGAWSEKRKFTVNNDHAKQPLIRLLSANAPLFTLEASKVWEFSNFHPDVPPDIAPNVAVIAEGYVDKGLTVEEFARGLDKLPHPFMVRSHPPTWVALSDVEWLCQNYPNFLGIQGGETLSNIYAEARGKSGGDAEYHRRMARICAKYGRFYHEADGTYKDDKWQDLWDRQGGFVREFGPWLALSQKNNIIRRQFYSQSAALGLWLGGVTAAHGAWEDGGFYWQNAGFNGIGVNAGERKGELKTMPRIFWSLNFVMGLTRGCTIYSMDGQTLMFSPKEAERFGQWQSALWDTTGKTTGTFNRFVVPLMRATLKHNLVATREQVLANTKLAVFNDRPKFDEKAWPHYAEYGPLYAGTYGFRKMGNIDGQLWEFFPNTGRYGFIPVLVHGDAPLPGVKNLPISQLQDAARVRELFDAAYPKWHDGDALVSRVGDVFTMLNSRENDDVTEGFSLPLKSALCSRVSGKIGPHAYLIGKSEESGRRLWLQTNGEYAERAVELALTCTSKPTWQITPAAGGEARWDDATKTLHLRLSHKDGAVEVDVK